MELKDCYDLHTHTRYSDGTYTVEELLSRAKFLGLKGISITDHDTMEGISEGREVAKKLELDFIPGIEFSCAMQGYEIHILGYFLDENCEELKNKLIELKEDRLNRNLRIVEKLNSRGLKITLKDIEDESTGSIVSRAHICNAMMKKGYVYSKGEAFKQYLGRKGVAYVEKRNSDPIGIIELIKRCGGISVLAHPNLISESREKVEEIVKILKNAGLDGLEVEYSSYTSKERKYYRKLAENMELLVTGGSDFHGENRVGVDVGRSYIKENELKYFFERGEGGKL